MGSPLYRFTVRRLSGARCKLDAYSGAVLLIVNVASPDIFTRLYGDLELNYLSISFEAAILRGPRPW